MERGTVVFEETSVEEEELWRDDDSGDRDGWWCVRTDPFPCPAAGCTYVAEFMTAAHLILVWQEQDDPNLLKHAARARDVGRNPRIVGYRADLRPERVVLRVDRLGPSGARRPRPVSPTSGSATVREGHVPVSDTGGQALRRSVARA